MGVGASGTCGSAMAKDGRAYPTSLRDNRCIYIDGRRDLALVYDAMQGHDPDDPVCAERAIEPTVARLDDGVDGLRIFVANGDFRKAAFPEVHVTLERVAAALDVNRDVAPGRSQATAIRLSYGIHTFLPFPWVTLLRYDRATSNR